MIERLVYLGAAQTRDSHRAHPQCFEPKQAVLEGAILGGKIGVDSIARDGNNLVEYALRAASCPVRGVRESIQPERRRAGFHHAAVSHMLNEPSQLLLHEPM